MMINSAVHVALCYCVTVPSKPRLSDLFFSYQCKMIAPIYEDLSKQYQDVAFGKIDVDNNQDSAAEFQISAVPTFVFSKGKETVNKFSGADKVQLEKLVKEL